jgi:hypothetical protein
MFKFVYISARGDVLPLTDNPYFYLTHVDGQTTAATSISSAVIGNIDGDTVNNVQATPRTIILDLRIRSGVDVEEAKREILTVVKLKQRGDLIWTQNDRTVTITGIVETIDMPRWTNAPLMQITLHCEQPFWEDIENVTERINEAISLHYFTEGYGDMLYFPEDGIVIGEYATLRLKSFYNDGDVAVGLEISILAHGTVTNPVIYNQDGNFFGVGYEERPFVMQTGDNLVITTHKGKKRVAVNGVNIFDRIKPRSTWFQLETGNNTFSINSDEDNTNNMSFSVVYRKRYI